VSWVEGLKIKNKNKKTVTIVFWVLSTLLKNNQILYVIVIKYLISKLSNVRKEWMRVTVGKTVSVVFVVLSTLLKNNQILYVVENLVCLYELAVL